MDTKQYALTDGALDIAQLVLHLQLEWVKGIDVLNTSVHIIADIPHDDDTADYEAEIEPLLKEFPFTTSEWWMNNRTGKWGLLVEPYWIMSPALDNDQVDEYERFMEAYR